MTRFLLATAEQRQKILGDKGGRPCRGAWHQPPPYLARVARLLHDAAATYRRERLTRLHAGASSVYAKRSGRSGQPGCLALTSRILGQALLLFVGLVARGARPGGWRLTVIDLLMGYARPDHESVT